MKVIDDEIENIDRARQAGIDPARPFFDFLIYLLKLFVRLNESDAAIDEAAFHDIIVGIESIDELQDDDTKIDALKQARPKFFYFLLVQYVEELSRPENNELLGLIKRLPQHWAFDGINDFGSFATAMQHPSLTPEMVDEMVDEIREEGKSLGDYKEIWNNWFFPGIVWKHDSGLDHETKRASLRWRAGSHSVVWANELPKILDQGGQIALVVLNSCQTSQSESRSFEASGVATTLIQSGIPAVIGMQLSIDDEAASIFSSEFYQCLAHGHFLEAALIKGRQAMESLENHQNWGVPTLYLKSQDVAEQFKIGEPNLMSSTPDSSGS